jgi:hypothetical protein
MQKGSCDLRSLFEQAHEQIQQGKGIPHDQFWREFAQVRAAKQKGSTRRKKG